MRYLGLVTGRWTRGQHAVAGLWAGNLLAVIVLWSATSVDNLSRGISGWLLAAGQLLGLLATYCALVQFMLMGRVAWIERRFGLDHLAVFHRYNGYATIAAIVLHAVVIIAAYSVATKTGFVAQYVQAVLHFPYVWMAFAAEILFVLVAITTVYIVRRHLRFESWYIVHMLVYAAIVLAFFHQFAMGGSLNGHPLARSYWYLLYVFVVLNVLFWRFSIPSINLLRYRFRVNRVVLETVTSTSIYIEGRGLSNWRVRPGQYVLVRFFTSRLWAQEHPFSISKLPSDGQFRLTVRHVGSYTSALQNLRPGTPVLVSGPFGRFTSEVAATDKRLFIAGGVGITPIITLAQEAAQNGMDAVLLYGSRSPADVVLKSEADQLTRQGVRVLYIYSQPDKKVQAGKNILQPCIIDGGRIKHLVPDYLERDIYLCGPPAMMETIIADLYALGVSPDRLHFERFSLHN